MESIGEEERFSLIETPERHCVVSSGHHDKAMEEEDLSTNGAVKLDVEVQKLHTSTPIGNSKMSRLQRFDPCVSPVAESRISSAAGGDADEMRDIDTVQMLADTQKLVLNLKENNSEFNKEQKVLRIEIKKLKSKVGELTKDNEELLKDRNRLVEDMKSMTAEAVSRTSQLKNLVRQKDVHLQNLLSSIEDFKHKMGIEQDNSVALKKQLDEQERRNQEALANEKEAIRVKEKNMEEELANLKAEKIQYEEAAKANEEKFANEINAIRNEKECLGAENQKLLESLNKLCKEQVECREEVKTLNNIIYKMKKDAAVYAEKEEELVKCKNEERITYAKLRETEEKLDEQLAENKKFHDLCEYYRQKVSECSRFTSADSGNLNSSANGITAASTEKEKDCALQEKRLKELTNELEKKSLLVASLENQNDERLKKIMLLEDKLAELRKNYGELEFRYSLMESEKRNLDLDFQEFKKTADYQYKVEMIAKEEELRNRTEELDHFREKFTEFVEKNAQLPLNDSSSILLSHDRTVWDVIPPEVRSMIESLKESYHALNSVVTAMKAVHVVYGVDDVEPKVLVDKGTEISASSFCHSTITLRNPSSLSSITEDSQDTSLVNSFLPSTGEVADKPNIREEAFSHLKHCLKMINAEARMTDLSLKFFLVTDFFNNIVHAAEGYYEVQTGTDEEKEEVVELNKKLADYNAKSQEAIEHLKDVTQEPEKDNHMLDEQISELKHALSEANKLLVERTALGNEAAEAIERYDSEVLRMRSMLDELGERNERLENELLMQKSENEHIKRMIGSHESRLLEELERKQKDLSAAKSECNRQRKKCARLKKLLEEAVDTYKLSNERIEFLLDQNTFRQKKIDLFYNFLARAGTDVLKVVWPLSPGSGKCSNKSREENEAEYSDLKSALEKVQLNAPTRAVEKMLEKLGMEDQPSQSKKTV